MVLHLAGQWQPRPSRHGERGDEVGGGEQRLERAVKRIVPFANVHSIIS